MDDGYLYNEQMLQEYLRAWRSKNPDKTFLSGWDSYWVEDSLADAVRGEVEAWIVTDQWDGITIFAVIEGAAVTWTLRNCELKPGESEGENHSEIETCALGPLSGGSHREVEHVYPNETVFEIEFTHDRPPSGAFRHSTPSPGKIGDLRGGL